MYSQPTRRDIYLAGSSQGGRPSRISKPRYANLVAEKIAAEYSDSFCGLQKSSIARAIAEGENLSGCFTSVEDAIFGMLRKLERTFTKDELHYMTKMRKYTTQRRVFDDLPDRVRQNTTHPHETRYDDSDTTERKRHELAVYFAERRATRLNGREDVTTTVNNEIRAMRTKTSEQVLAMYKKYFGSPSGTLLLF
ncbi:MAG: hypothetical protein QT00_C0001G0514 [archaeon GW2011_AR5]|nr:MAG: hypothetical protein QT00_C0001G0514 [archaeon GW2011_AR5]